MNQLIFGIATTVYLACLYSIVTEFDYTVPFIGMVGATLTIFGCGCVSIYKEVLKGERMD